MQLAIYPRTKINWKNITLTDLMKFNQKRRIKRRPRIHRFIVLWDQTFSVTFFQYRQRMLEIAQDSWARTGLPILSELKPGLLVIPVDDDDWFNPRIQDDIKFPCKWDMGRFFTCRGSIAQIEYEPGFHIFTNNACLPTRYIERGLYQRHWNANKKYNDLLQHYREVYSFTNKTSASISSIIHNPFHYELGVELIQDIPSWAEWAKPYIHSVLAFNQEVMDSRTPRYKLG